LAQEGDYFLLNEAGVPAALVETGFISNPAESRLLADGRYRSRLAWAVYLGIVRYFAGNCSRE
jgi:N-acetylmuramoyl-L-alanine amidase